MTNLETLISRIKLLSDEQVTNLLDAVTAMMGASNIGDRPDCPYCGSQNIIRYGHKCNKQRFYCKGCRRTFVTTTHTIMSHSRFPEEVWQEAIADTLRGDAIDYIADSTGLFHQAAFDMRHKILMALQQMPEIEAVCLGDVSELDETFVLDCHKGKKLGDDIPRKPRKHGAKAGKRGISDEYVCICAGIQRKGDAYAATVNRAKPDAREIQALFKDHIASGTLVLCDGLKSYSALPAITDCTVKDCSHPAEGEKCFYHLNTVNGFHSFIKSRYHFYRGVATKYLNRYNAMFSATYRNVEPFIRRAKEVLLKVGKVNYYHSIRDTRESGLLAL